MTPEDAANSAWVEAEIPLPPAELLAFCRDLERLWRLNPQLTLDAWQTMSDGFALRAADETDGRRIDVVGRYEDMPGGFRVTYEGGLKRATEFAISPRGDGSLLRVVERYWPVPEAAAAVDHSLVPWVAAVRRHVVARSRWQRVPGWRLWSERFMLSMPPRQRRIVRMIVWLTLIEFVVFVFAVAALRLG